MSNTEIAVLVLSFGLIAALAYLLRAVLKLRREVTRLHRELGEKVSAYYDTQRLFTLRSKTHDTKTEATQAG